MWRSTIGTVGLTEAEARDAGLDVEIYRSSFRPMVHTLSGRDEKTMMKLVVDGIVDQSIPWSLVLTGVAITISLTYTRPGGNDRHISRTGALVTPAIGAR